jgi:hypothetical protein
VLRDSGIAQVLRLIFALVDIMLHRRGPDGLPSSQFLFWLLLAVMLASSFAALIVGGITPPRAAVMLLVVGLEFWFVWALLRLFERQRRFRQTMTAVLGVDAVIAALTIPLIPFSQPVVGGQMLPPASLAVLALEIWSIDVHAFVLSRALDRPYLLTLAVTIAYVLLMMSLQATLLPRPA